MPEPLLRIEGIFKMFGATEALHDVSFEVASGEIVALLGFTSWTWKSFDRINSK